MQVVLFTLFKLDNQIRGLKGESGVRVKNNLGGYFNKGV